MNVSLEPTQEPRHATYGPSSFKYREICPGWRNDNSGDSAAADEGTMLHLAAETGVLNGLNEEQQAAVRNCLDYIAPLERRASRVHKELRLSILGGLTFGTADRVMTYSLERVTYADLVDFKFGQRPVDDANENRQGMAYVLGVFSKFPDVQAVTVHFLSPRRDEILRHTFHRSDIPRLELIVRTIIARAEEYSKTGDESLLNPTEESCTWCGHKAKCQALKKYALTVSNKYEPLEIVDDVHSSEITDPNKMARAFTLARVMERWAESVKKHALEMVKNGTEIPGYELRERASAREINNPTLAFPTLRKFLEPEEIVSSAKLSLSKLEKFISDRAGRGEKTKAIKEFNTALLEAECVTSGEPIRFLQKIRE